MDSLSSILRQAAAVGALQDRIKARAMLYQPELKETVAAELGLSWAEVDRPYATWAEIRANYLKYKDCQRRRQRKLAAAYREAAIRAAK